MPFLGIQVKAQGLGKAGLVVGLDLEPARTETARDLQKIIEYLNSRWFAPRDGPASKK